ncbi:hypothetical protein [Ascidiimonas sp. W6]|uniref:hypothetical protein n=1 Tax=Ascidiimonas meishanensis TaxID=3128903 RepID=UPI0030EE3B9E
MKKNEIIKVWKSQKNRGEITNLIGSPEVDKEIVKGGREAIDSAGYICTVSGEVWPYISCNPKDWF